MRFLAVAPILITLLASTAAAQIPLPVEEHATTRRAMKRRNPVKALEARVNALERQLQAIRELRNWAKTSRRELEKIYSDSLANLKQAHFAIHRAKGKSVKPFHVPRGFEVEPIRVGTGSYPSYSSSTVPVVPPDDFRLFLRATFPDAWVAERKRLRINCQIYPEGYLPMASRYQNTSKAVYYVSSYSQRVNGKTTAFNAKVNGQSLTPGRYFASCVLRTATYPAEFLVSLGMFRVKGTLPPALGPLLPHHLDWYRTYKSVLKLDELKATARGKAIQLSGAYTRSGFERDQQPVHILALAERAGDRTVVLRTQQKLTRETMRFGGRKFLIKNHGLKPGTYLLKVYVLTEHPSSTSRYAYTRGSRAYKSVELRIP